jgi:membrane protease subunit HflK
MYDGNDDDPFEAIRKGFERFANRTKKDIGGSHPDGKRIARWLVAAAMAALAIWAGLSSFYQVGTESTGVVLRFGRFTNFAEPGLHFRLPFGIDRVYQVATGRVLKLEFGFRTVQADVRTEYSAKQFDEESLTLTGDLNVSDLEWIVQYQVADPFKYLFRIKAPEETIRTVAEAAVRMAVGNSNVTDVLTTERAVLASQIQQNLQAILTGYDIGVRIVTVKFQDVNPPEPVKAAFNEVNEAQQEKESLIFQAREQYNREVPKSAGVAKSTILEAEGYALERLNRATGETARFLALLAEFDKAPLVTRQRLYLETLEEVLPRVEQIYVMDGKAPSALPLLQLRGRTEEVKP